MLETLRKVELLRCRNLALQPAERDLGHRMARVVQGVAQSSNKMREVEDRMREYKYKREQEVRRSGVSSSSTTTNTQLSKEEKEHLFLLLNEKNTGLQQLVKMVNTDVRDVGIIKKYLVNRKKQGTWVQ